ncbi:MAG: DUF4912 domain-containing protein [Planctomycetales bacterium]|nr:DUF4912 domain-containing protein [Planctomycetales bacterium]
MQIVKYWRYKKLITAATLQEYTSKDLGQMAKKRGIAGWHSMRKAELIKALVKDSQTNPRGKSVGKTVRPKTEVETSSAPKLKPRVTSVGRNVSHGKIPTELEKNLAGATSNGNGTRDRLVLMVRDSYWLHAHWEITSSAIQRAQAAMAEAWHTAKPVLRLFNVETGNTTSTIERHTRDIPIHGAVDNWYIDVNDPPKGYRVEIGFVSSSGRYHAVARSNTVVTPRPGSSDTLDRHWGDVAENCEKIFAMSGGYSDDGRHTDEIQELFEERLRRPMGSPMETRFGMGANLEDSSSRDLSFDLDAEMIVYGSTKSDAYVTLGGEPVKLRPDGTFTVRLSMPDRRQVLPVVACTRDGMKQQTIVLAVERNTKVMEPVMRDSAEYS